MSASFLGLPLFSSPLLLVRWSAAPWCGWCWPDLWSPLHLPLVVLPLLQVIVPQDCVVHEPFQAFKTLGDLVVSGSVGVSGCHVSLWEVLVLVSSTGLCLWMVKGLALGLTNSLHGRPFTVGSFCLSQQLKADLA